MPWVRKELIKDLDYFIILNSKLLHLEIPHRLDGKCDRLLHDEGVSNWNFATRKAAISICKERFEGLPAPIIGLFREYTNTFNLLVSAFDRLISKVKLML